MKEIIEIFDKHEDIIQTLIVCTTRLMLLTSIFSLAPLIIIGTVVV